MSSDFPLSKEWVDTAMATVDDLNAGWAWWQWRENSGWGIRNGDGNRINTAFLRHLARPYLAAAPTGVRAGHGDGVHGTLHVSVDASRGAGAIAIAWPRYTLGNPQLVSSCGATSTWDAASSRITVMVPPAVACTIDLAVAAG
jgi:hypothetical protein